METKINGATTDPQRRLECYRCGWTNVPDLRFVDDDDYLVVACANRFACWTRAEDLVEYLDRAHGQFDAGK